MMHFLKLKNFSEYVMVFTIKKFWTSSILYEADGPFALYILSWTFSGIFNEYWKTHFDILILIQFKMFAHFRAILLSFSFKTVNTFTSHTMFLLLIVFKAYRHLYMAPLITYAQKVYLTSFWSHSNHQFHIKHFWSFSKCFFFSVIYVFISVNVPLILWFNKKKMISNVYATILYWMQSYSVEK